MMKKLQSEPFYATCVKKKKKKKKGLSERAAAKEINGVEVQEIVKKCVAQNWFRHFKEYDTNLENKLRSGRPLLWKMRLCLKHKHLYTVGRTWSFT